MDEQRKEVEAREKEWYEKIVEFKNSDFVKLLEEGIEQERKFQEECIPIDRELEEFKKTLHYFDVQRRGSSFVMWLPASIKKKDVFYYDDERLVDIFDERGRILDYIKALGPKFNYYEPTWAEKTINYIMFELETWSILCPFLKNDRSKWNEDFLKKYEKSYQKKYDRYVYSRAVELTPDTRSLRVIRCEGGN